MSDAKGKTMTHPSDEELEAMAERLEASAYVRSPAYEIKAAAMLRACKGARAPSPAPDVRGLLTAAMSALRSYQYGNAAPDLAEGIADKIAAALATQEAPNE